ncbi:MAG: UDP-N-acetylmuramoyl-L-alanyl-D-glutamate--2,6-diaminopimelate ligase [Bacteroidetes bacterium]|nr:UDP-N-acetylmuramoyl-L-alanyl-D-glutamate--2,6-diaminopimelate ligase [Bacteroidota bacterium]MDA1121082.1 UDP-N-acetylmuramoyl-L-alanyl-D-glutamate--2,6-diaminopimelate ligase [Bacteroidota bacterium]
MILLKDLLYKASLVSVAGDMNVGLSSLCFDSRESKQDCLFFAIKGTQSDGHHFIYQAIEKGSRAIVCDEMPKEIKDDVTYIQVDNSAKTMGIVASNFYDNPSSKLKLVGVTGTNGKTTTVTLLFNLFRKLGYNTGLLSTIQNQINDEVISTELTTPDSLKINQLLVKMVEKGCTHCFMEASSHAIVQHRVTGLSFSGVVFTNISHDHLDYHSTFDDYIAAKKQIFDSLSSTAFALVNIDDKRGKIMLQNTKANKKTYSLNYLADFKGKVVTNSFQGLEMEIDHETAWFRLIGDFNAYNLLAVYGTASLLEENKNDILTAMSALTPAKGRFEQVPNNLGIIALVDYSHTPDALENALKTIKNFRTGNEKVITVVGCGGSRDKTKRPIMAKIALNLSNNVILTSDNPRNEEPEQILKDMQVGITPNNYRKMLVISDRKEAIKTACTLAEKNDIILIAGKGHENYQEIKGVKYPFDDREVLMEMLNVISN